MISIIYCVGACSHILQLSAAFFSRCVFAELCQTRGNTDVVSNLWAKLVAALLHNVRMTFKKCIASLHTQSHRVVTVTVLTGHSANQTAQVWRKHPFFPSHWTCVDKVQTVQLAVSCSQVSVVIVVSVSTLTYCWILLGHVGMLLRPGMARQPKTTECLRNSSPNIHNSPQPRHGWWEGPQSWHEQRESYHSSKRTKHTKHTACKIWKDLMLDYLDLMRFGIGLSSDFPHFRHKKWHIGCLQQSQASWWPKAKGRWIAFRPQHTGTFPLELLCNTNTTVFILT